MYKQASKHRIIHFSQKAQLKRRVTQRLHALFLDDYKHLYLDGLIKHRV